MNKLFKTSLINGVAADFLSIEDRSIHYGDGLFETILFDDGKLLYWEQHYQRLLRSAIRLKIHCPRRTIVAR